MEKRSKLSRFEYLDGYRGFLVITVVLQHTWNANEDIMTGEYKIFKWTGTYVGVVGFFLLSAFLLTYRLLHMYATAIPSDSSWKVWWLHVFRITFRFFIGRFFRVYVPYMVYVTLMKWVSAHHFGGYPNYGRFLVFKSTWLSHATLTAIESTHLWTMPVELNFYLYYPLIPFLFAFIPNRLWIIVWATLMFVSTYFRNTEYFAIVIQDKYPYFVRYYYEFFVGAMLAVVFYKIEDTLYDIKSNPKLVMVINAFNFVCGVASVLLIYQGYKFFSGFFTPKRDHLKVTENMYEGTLYWSVFIISMLVGDKNFFTEWFSTNKFITTCGTYSYGIYLYHIICITFVQYSKPTSNFENFIQSLLTSWLIGCASYHLLEKRLMTVSASCIVMFEKQFPKENKNPVNLSNIGSSTCVPLILTTNAYIL